MTDALTAAETSDPGEIARQRSDEVEGHPHRAADIAIVGMATLLPGADSLASYWRRILSGESAIREIPPDRWSLAACHDASSDPHNPPVHHGGILDDVPFEPLAYGIQPATIPSIEPMQLLALQVVREAIADSLQGAVEDPERERTSVILGFTGGVGELGQRYMARSALPDLIGAPDADLLSRLPEWTQDSFPGILPNVIAGRIANRLDFGGTNMIVDAAAASSLAAVYHAVMELDNRRSDRVVAGGVDAGLTTFSYLSHSESGMLSGRGSCQVFDNDADGIVLSEGVAAVVLRRLADAERDGDRIYAVIKGAGASSDGRTDRPDASTRSGQRRALDRAYLQAGFAAASVELFEAQGPGTPGGDRDELQALNEMLAEAGAPQGAAAVGSVKPLLGHAPASCGIAGLIKMALGLHHHVLPPHALVQDPIAVLADPASPLYLAQSPRPWVRPPDRPRRAAISASGTGGTNFHVALEEHVDPFARPATIETGGDLVPVLFAAADRAGIVAQLDRADPTTAASLQAFARAVAAKAAAGAERVGFLASSLAEAATRIAAARAFVQMGGSAPEGVHHRSATASGCKPRVALLIPGEEAAHPGMLRRTALLLPALADHLAAAEAALAGVRATVPRLSRLVWPGEGFDAAARRREGEALASSGSAHAAIAALQVGLASAVRDLGLAPVAVAARAGGQLVARHLAGKLAFDDMIRLGIGEAAVNPASRIGAIPAFDLTTGRALDAAPAATQDDLPDPAAILASLASMGVTHLVDIGPGFAVSDGLRRLTVDGGPRIVALDRDGGDAPSVLDGLVQLWAEGVPLDLARLVERVAEPRSRRGPEDLRTAWMVNGAYARPANAPPRSSGSPASLAAGGQTARAAPATPPAAARPGLLLRGARRRPGESRVLDRRIDQVEAPYLEDHRFDGRPVLPMVAFLQAAAEVPGLLGLAGEVVAIEDLRVFRGVTLEGPWLDLRFTLDGPDEAGRCRITLTDPATPLRPLYRCDAILAPAVPSSIAHPRPASGAAWTGKPLAEIYRDWLSHGPRFQTLTDLDHIGPRSIRARGNATDPAEFVAVPRGRQWAFDPGLLDGLLQTVWIWARVMQNSSALPLSAAAIRRYAGNPQAGPVTAEVEILTHPDEAAIQFNLRAFDVLGGLIYELEGFECRSDPRLNRLGGGWQGGQC